jgi:predicted transcriptional regulator
MARTPPPITLATVRGLTDGPGASPAPARGPSAPTLAAEPPRPLAPAPEPFLSLGVVAAQTVQAYVANNPVPVGDFLRLLQDVHATLQAFEAPSPAPAQPAPEPPIPIRKTITPDAIISLEDGKPYKTLARHLKNRGMTPAEYRAKWGLPLDYPMTARNYAAQRSELAKANGLGKRT